MACVSCGKPNANNSKYCKEHKAAARAAWLANIREQAAARDEFSAKMSDLYQRAYDAGMQAGQNACPTPMVVAQRADMLDDSSPIVKVYEPVMDGVCGFGWVTVLSGNSRTANWLKKNFPKKWGKAYEGGVRMYVHEFNQSYERKMKFAHAFADVLENGLAELDPKVRVYSGGRLD